MKSIDGRRARWFDCDWNNDSGIQNACEMCRICDYMNFIDYAESVGKPEGSVIGYVAKLEEYLSINTLEGRQNWIIKNNIRGKYGQTF